MGPRDAIAKFTVPVDIMTGEPITDAQYARIEAIRTAYSALTNAMHDAEGSDPGNPSFQSRRMAIANTQIELGLLMAFRAAMEAK